MTLFVIPAILIAACYIIIVCTIWNKGKEMSVQPTTAITTDQTTTCTTAGGNIIQVKLNKLQKDQFLYNPNFYTKVRGKSQGGREEEVESR